MSSDTKMVDPVLSVVVVIVSDTTDSRRDASHLAVCLDALHHQQDAPSLEIIVPYLSPVKGLDEVKSRFPQVSFIPVDLLKPVNAQGGSREHHDQLRALGLGSAHGEIIGLLEDHARPDLHWCAQVVAAHRQHPEYAGIGGAIENDIDRTLNWAVYYCDFGKYQNPVPAGESPFASDANIAYKRTALESIKPVWQAVFHETAVNWNLGARGDKIALSPEIIVYQHRSDLRVKNALQERFIWGRSYAATRSQMAGDSKRLMYAALSPVLPVVLLARMTANAVKKNRHLGAFFRALPLTTLLTLSWASGEFVGYLTTRTSNSSVSVAQANARVS